MAQTNDERWDRARGAAIRRWQAALECIDARDERGTLAIANSMDELCREAARVGSLASGSQASKNLPCRHCRAFAATGGCLGFVGALNHRVLNELWDSAKQLVEEHIRALTPRGER